MRVVASPNGGKDRGQSSLQAEIDRHTDALSRFAEQARSERLVTPTCTLVLRSARSAPALALTQTKDALASVGIEARAILTKIDPEPELHEFFATLSALAPDADVATLIRWARHPRLVDVHEQAVYGPALCWTGDVVRRDADRRNQLALFEATPEALLRATHAFRALWAISKTLPPHLLDFLEANSGANAEEATEEAPVAPMKPPAEGWPLVRH